MIKKKYIYDLEGITIGFLMNFIPKYLTDLMINGLEIN